MGEEKKVEAEAAANRRTADCSSPLAFSVRRCTLQSVNYAILVLLGCLFFETVHATDQKDSDAWLTNKVSFPRDIDTRLVRPADFESLHAQEISGRLLFFWEPKHLDTNANVSILTSVGPADHHAVRDWREYRMNLSGARWQARVPVDDIDIPIIYFVRTVYQGVTNVSPMRICHPRAMGLEAPTRPFWPFLEGFEQDPRGWSLIPQPGESEVLQKDGIAKSGYSSLRISLPVGKHSATVATTRVQGWQIQQNQATGIRLWLRTKSGTGRARFTLYENAFTTNQVVAVYPVESELNDQWHLVDLRFEVFPKLSLGAIDWFTVEFIGTGPTEFLIDDLQFIGPWKTETE
ncbi:hypothetical protein Cflav_PD3411 [Pedosphaera parvula Ellin514]|uniref:Uncharacterized protein n=1 Tax=Pedosphaera parvula (strain Ellin514) TaxID=320771 RepID=B9XII0_PEDPL|nr:hypothetical protein Cflav_PD3411 [Pedosphaera parvula Ellin514]